ncbi:MAG: hypothetical protein HY231_24775 [Acidobacteria bacterium]|nr:hypothetical protein [Acidobacteriota bacterium]
MFGLMKARSCSQPAEQQRQRRLHYCGTCKTLGRLYGQKTRALLNHDTVFLAEVLSAIAADSTPATEWAKAYQSFNCLALPEASHALPLPLQLAATATVVLTEFKIADHLVDSQRRIWKGAQRWFSKSFQAAYRQLQAWQFPLDDLQQALQSQQSREQQARHSTASTEAILADLAAPTAIATALFCQHGARLIGQSSHAATLYTLGYNFGALAYRLDALEDFAQDRRQGNFNALRAAYKIADEPSPAAPPHLPIAIRRAVVDQLRVLQAAIEKSLRQLPMSESSQAMFATRLHLNLSSKLGGLPVLHQHHQFSLPPTATPISQPSESTCESTSAHQSAPTVARCCPTKMKLAERWRNAVSCGRALASQARNPTSSTSHFAARLRQPLVFAGVFPLAFFAPHQVGEAKSFGECLGLGLNLMFIGSVVATFVMLLTRPLRFAAQRISDLINAAIPVAQIDPQQQGGFTPQGSGRHGRKRGNADGTSSDGCCANCFCCCEDGSECCCTESCNCCECHSCDCNCCDGCDCCACDCS